MYFLDLLSTFYLGFQKPSLVLTTKNVAIKNLFSLSHERRNSLQKNNEKTSKNFKNKMVNKQTLVFHFINETSLSLKIKF